MRTIPPLGRLGLAILGAALAFGAVPLLSRGQAAETHVIPPPATPFASTAPEETIVLAGGCFWGVQGVFQHTTGVTSAVSGYAGGDAATTRYDAVSSGRTGHAEAVRVTYDPRQVSLGTILQIYFSVAHDPTQLNRQGPDHGTQYRSAIFPSDDGQARFAQAYMAELDAARVFPAKIATTVEHGQRFHPAEAYHQDYMTRHPGQPYIAINDLPKVEALSRMFPDAYRTAPVLVASAGE